MMTFKNILCPVDFSENTNKVLDIAAKLAEDNATISIFHHSLLIAPAPDMEAVNTFEVDKELIDIDLNKLEKYRDDLKLKYPKLTFKSHHSYEPGIQEQINAIVKAENCDLIVMGTHGRTGLSRLLMGSVAEDVLRHATCPVFLIKI
jgi:universal stress protein A